MIDKGGSILIKAITHLKTKESTGGSSSCGKTFANKIASSKEQCKLCEFNAKYGFKRKTNFCSLVLT